MQTTEVEAWVDAYVHAWRTASPKDIKALFAPAAEYHEWPYVTDWIGRAEIVEGWLSRQKWQEGGWEFEWSILMINGDTAAIKGTGVYKELGTFLNLWTVTFDKRGKCLMFRMWNNEI
ncbi:nuclear transport factor 2 family protein [Kibdelosporangium philippinense]|uniref:Nuclear transport factor 2 family protein n=1 Tax=Kibdelosporangium philippinense TaxID=211113 RepID=A0ABS8ZRX4_9PSEU|nr:nuclear transport factor 2 family protein [Kibdelosporangium philippinense]MCE7010412.1 nuclear transport factor 2 family protein [Kibdelosporangium philippinense]